MGVPVDHLELRDMERNRQQLDQPLELLFGLNQRAIRSADLKELGFVIANETWHLLPYRQAIVFFRDRLGKPALTTISGLANCSESTPYTQWLATMADLLDKSFPGKEPAKIGAGMFEEDVREAWQEWWPESVLFVPLTAQSGKRAGFVLFLRDDPWQDNDAVLLGTISETWAHCANSFLVRRFDAKSWREKWLAPGRRKTLTIAAIVALLFPIRISALAPAEIIPLQAEAIASPMDGVVKTFHVRPNTQVKEGELLFSLDDTTLRNRRAVAEKALAVARADALAAQQKAFDNDKSRSELSSLIAQVRERQAELAFVDESLARVDFKAPQDGIFVYTDPNDWIGKPVQTGERVGQIAQPDSLGVLMWLPVGDAINLEPGAEIRMYTQTSPLSAMDAELIQTSYQATMSPEGIVAYRLRGKLTGASEARIGLRGTAKVYGEWRPIIYWMLRRPLGALRQFLGV